MQGTLIVKRDPATIGTLLIALVMLGGQQLGWSIELTGSISAFITAAVGVVMALNVFGTDQFVAVAIHLVAAAATVYAAWSGVPVSDAVLTLIITVVTAGLSFFVRNGVTNRVSAVGQPRAVVSTSTSGIPSA